MLFAPPSPFIIFVCTRNILFQLIAFGELNKFEIHIYFKTRWPSSGNLHSFVVIISMATKDTPDRGTRLRPDIPPGDAQSRNSATGNICPWRNSTPIHNSRKTSVMSRGLDELQNISLVSAIKILRPEFIIIITVILMEQRKYYFKN